VSRDVLHHECVIVMVDAASAFHTPRLSVRCLEDLRHAVDDITEITSTYHADNLSRIAAKIAASGGRPFARVD
jgi:hypothetical protein